MAVADAGKTLAHAIAETLDALTLTPADTAAKKLARDYADAIDDARTARDLAARALSRLSPDDDDGRAYVLALAAKLEAREMLAQLGPKLLATLEALGATPAARAAIARRATTRTPDAAPGRLAQLRAAHGA